MQIQKDTYRRNEVPAREGIDTAELLSQVPYQAQGRNEVPAREGIDTLLPNSLGHLRICRNEVLAREGIDTVRRSCTTFSTGFRRNEVTAREGIDTPPMMPPIPSPIKVAMRY